MPKITITLDDIEKAKFELAYSTYCRILRTNVPKAEFARFCLLWFVNGFLRDDVGQTPEGVIDGINDN